MKKKLIVIFIVALVLRLSLIFVAHHGDLNNNISWGTLAVERGLAGFYEGENWPYSAPNQPPLTVLMFAASRMIWQVIENASWWLNNNFAFFYSPFIWFWESSGMDVLVKLPGILADLGIGWLIYKYVSERKKGFALTLAAVWLFNPVAWYNSAIWGQTDSIVNLLGLLGIFALLRKKLILFSIFFTLSLLFKGSLAIFVPVVLLVAYLHKHPLKTWLKAVGYSLATTLLVSVWFHPQPDIFSWLFSLYKGRILPGEIGYLTANAFNFWWLVNPGRVLDSAVFFGLPARVWGFVTASLGVFGIVYWLRRRLSDKRVFISLAMTALIAFLFMTRIHERYLYPFFPYATVLLFQIPGLAFAYTLLSITHLLNLYHLFWAPSFAPLEALYNEPLFPQALAAVNILVFFYLLRLFKPQKL